MELLFLLLPLINFSHAQYWPQDPALVEAVEAAFIKKDTLLQLLYTFYPPNRLQPNHVQLRIGVITVRNITDGSGVSNPAYTCYDYDYIVCRYIGSSFNYFDLYVFEEDKSHPNLLAFISSPGFTSSMALFDGLSYTLYTTLTFFQPYEYDDDYVNIDLSIDSLESLPSKDDLTQAMGVVFSWVSISAPKPQDCTKVIIYRLNIMQGLKVN